MSNTALKYQCPACGGTLIFSPQKQMLVCEFCESAYPKDLFETPTAPNSPPNAPPQAPNTPPSAPPNAPQTQSPDWSGAAGYVHQNTTEAQTGFCCDSCGAQVVTDNDTVATECMYCGNPVVMANNISGMLTPDLVLPFQIEKKQAQEMLKKFYEGKKLLPDAFRDQNRISKITGLYVPFWLFSCTGTGQATFEAKKVKSWSDGNYRYTKTRVYEAFRSGQVGFEKIPVDASSKMADDYMDGLEPFDYRALSPFEPMYMAGYFADKFDVGVPECTTRVNARVLTSVEQAFQGTVTGFNSIVMKNSDIHMADQDIKYALLPVWMLNTKYNGKMYQFAINGQTGKVSGELPVDKKKLFLWRLGLTLGTALPVAAIALYLLH